MGERERNRRRMAPYISRAVFLVEINGGDEVKWFFFFVFGFCIEFFQALVAHLGR
jgi:hypothetical protein